MVVDKEPANTVNWGNCELCCYPSCEDSIKGMVQNGMLGRIWVKLRTESPIIRVWGKTVKHGPSGSSLEVAIFTNFNSP